MDQVGGELDHIGPTGAGRFKRRLDVGEGLHALGIEIVDADRLAVAADADLTGNEQELDMAFAKLGQSKPDALLVIPDPVFLNLREQFGDLEARYAIPTIHYSRENVAAGGLLSYGSSLKAMFHQAGIYVGRILGGAKPSDLPIVQPTKFELAINLKTAKALGVDVPPSLLARADEVIE